MEKCISLPGSHPRFSGTGVDVVTMIHHQMAHMGPVRGELLGNCSPQFIANEPQIKQQSLENVTCVWIVSHKLWLSFLFCFQGEELASWLILNI